MVRVLVWAKSGVTRAGLEAIVQADPRFELAGNGSRAPDLVTAVRELAPEVVLVDASDTAVSRLLSALPEAPAAPVVVVLMEGAHRADILRLVQSGVRAVIARDSDPQEIAAAIESARDGLVVFSPEILDLVVPTAMELAGVDDLPPGEPLTAREIDVLGLLAEGAGNKEIAARLGISEHTVKFHVSSILGKLGAATRTEAVSRGYKEGLILI